MLTEWLRSAMLVEDGAPFLGVHHAEVGVHADALSFQVSHGGPLYPGPRRVTLWVDRSSLTPRRGLLAEVAPLPGSSWTAADTVELAPEATDLALMYLVEESGRERWVAEWQSVYQLPMAIGLRLSSTSAITLGGAPSRDGLHALLALPIVVRVGVESW